MWKTLAAGLAVLAVLVTCGCSRTAAAGRNAQATAIPVSVAVVEQRSVPITIHASGSVEPAASVVMLSRVDGEIVRVMAVDGQEVAAGQALVQIDPQPTRIQVRMAQATLERDRAQLADARAKEAHGRALRGQNFISDDDYLQLKTNLDGAAATVELDRAALAQTQLQLDYTTLRAPMAGKLGHIAEQPGNFVRAASTTPLVTLNVLDALDVSFTVPEQQLPAVRRALASGVATVAIPIEGASSPPLSTQVSFVDNEVDRTSGTIRLRARLDNRQRALWPGQFVTVDLTLGADPEAIVVPGIAVQQGPEGPYVYIVRSDLSVEQRAVTVQRAADSDTVLAGVRPGERVIIDGQSRVTPGARVAIHSPNMGHPATSSATESNRRDSCFPHEFVDETSSNSPVRPCTGRAA